MSGSDTQQNTTDNVVASGTDSIAIGTSSVASANNAIALGLNAKALTANSVALGNGATTAAAVATKSGVIGGTTYTYAGAAPTGVVSVGAAGAEREVTNVAAGQVTSTSTDAVNGSQLYATNTQVTANTTALTNLNSTVNNITDGGGITYFHTNSTLGDSSATGTNATAIGPAAKAGGPNSIAIGNGASTNLGSTADGNIAMGANAVINNTGDGVIVIGRNAYVDSTLGNSSVTGASSVVIGDGAFGYGNGVTVLGASASAAHSGNVAIGMNALSSGNSNSSAIGNAAIASGTGASAMGAGAVASATNSTAIGRGASASTANSVALGNGATTAAAVATADGVIGGQTFTYAGTAPTGVVSMGAAGAERQVTNVAAGQVTSTSTDAVNGSQLYATNTQVTANTTALNSLGGRVANVEDSVENLTNQFNTGGVGLVKQDTDTKAITVASATGGTVMNITGTDGARTLTGVANGKVATDSTDAVNGSQLAETKADVAQNTSDIATNATKIDNVDGRVTIAEDSIAKNTADIAENTANLSGLMSGSVGLVQQNAATGDISIGGAAGGNTVNVAGTDGARVVRGIANGTGDTDAVTIAQLKAVGLVDPNGQALGALVYDDLSFGRATLGGTNGTVIGNLANGLVAANSMEAVNGGQLYALKDQFETQYKELSTHYDQLNVQVTSLGDQFTNHVALVGNAELPGTGTGSTAVGSDAIASGENSTSLGTNSSATGNNSVALGQSSVADRDNSVSVGSAGNERQITNVAAGTASTDAVNLGQVNNLLSQSVQQSNSYTDQRFDQANHAINDVARNAYAGIAAAMAMPNMTPSGPGRTIVAAGAGNYKSGSAAAVGVTYRSRNDKWLMNGAVSVTSTGDAGVRAQIGYEF